MMGAVAVRKVSVNVVETVGINRSSTSSALVLVAVPSPSVAIEKDIFFRGAVLLLSSEKRRSRNKS